MSQSHANPSLWERIKTKVTADDLGGRPGQWSAIKAMIASKQYKEAGGTYIGKKDDTKGLAKWMKEDWRTLSGQPSLKTGERFLPRKAIESLTPAQYAATTAKKRKDTRQGKQFSQQPSNIAELVKQFRQ
jgi:hypothetical protein